MSSSGSCERSNTAGLWLRALVTVAAAALCALVLPGVDAAPSEILLFAALTALFYLLLQPVWRAVTLAFDLLLFGIPGLLADAAVLTLALKICGGYFSRFGWAFLTAVIIEVCRKLATRGVLTKSARSSTI